MCNPEAYCRGVGSTGGSVLTGAENEWSGRRPVHCAADSVVEACFELGAPVLYEDLRAQCDQHKATEHIDAAP